MKESYYAGCYWLARQEPIEACAQRLAGFLQLVSPLEPTWNRWHQAAGSFKKARQLQVQPDATTLAKLLGRKAHRFKDMSSFWLWAGETEDETSGFDGNCGSASTRVASFCVLNSLTSGQVAQRVLTAPVLTGVVRAMALAWEPEFALATSHEHRDLTVTDEFPKAGTYVGWVMYFAHFRGTVP
ncbi:hypothetical protein D7V97_37375, partial [Corallococcus sp. CA053C]|uniref:Imm52 family immunity protein n=1 Tax=Corallococcus sp. CA053C TaxID=2316732 RepID=UPI000EA25B71